MNDRPMIITPWIVIRSLVIVAVVPFLPLLISWRWGWWEAWVFALICVLGFAVSRVLVARRHPDLIAERARFLQHEDAKSWDKILAPLVGLSSALIVLVAGLDQLFGWSPAFNLTVKLIALLVILAGFVLASYALIENRFFSGMVRLQSDRGQRVVSSGPYRWMRHPGYLGGILTYIATPPFLDSGWAYIPAAILTILLVLRTYLEDRTLQDELAGYREYSTRVRYRLLPGVW